MRLALLPLCLAALPLCAQWDLRLELPRPTGQSLPQTMLSGTGQLVAGELGTGNGWVATLSHPLVQAGPLLRFEGSLDYSRLSVSGDLAKGTGLQGAQLRQQGVGLGLNAQVWVPFTGLAGEIGLIQRFHRYTLDTAGAGSARNLSRTWLRVGTRYRLPSIGVQPYLVASYQQPVTRDHPVKLSSVADLAAYFAAQGSGQEFERMWTFGAGVAF